MSEITSKFTKRKVFSIVSSLFDPLGFLSPLVIRRRIFIRSLWREKVGWDQPLNPEQIKEITAILREFQRVDEFVFPRQVVYEAVELHVFVDASSEAYRQ